MRKWQEWREIVGDASRVTDPVKLRQLANELEHALDERDEALRISHTKSDASFRHRLLEESSALVGALRNCGVEFLTIDIELGLSLGQAAIRLDEGPEKDRAATSARRAYETVQRLMSQVQLSPEEVRQLDAKLESLRHTLQRIAS